MKDLRKSVSNAGIAEHPEFSRALHLKFPRVQEIKMHLLPRRFEWYAR